MNELAEFAVTLDDEWKWLPGMVDSYQDIVVSGPPSGDWIYICGRMDEEDTKLTVAIGQTVSGTLPDLTALASVGIVMGMVRFKYGPNTWTVFTPRGWQVMTWESLEQCGGPVFGVPYTVERINCIIMASEEMPTEIHALIAALAKTE